ncbi:MULTISPECIES: DedA family protein [Ramlibacter]|uniref:Alkaline phosphatase n=1 Tax=Ramlibacter pinisoli TaxID=2682844 RepID=A0A6N8J0G8_9BURK|nr:MULTISPECIES: VTT domain-containing protein [Ramlibacter]MBA2961818.1 VTT domain-containing protein [Ramlibacter sp. CGMCC 1.13660]MVQ31760.1 alkaline phosphatase [Ramlibacter pinisoli]
MDFSLSLLLDPQAVQELLRSNWTLGLIVAAGVIFLETGVVVFPFLPGDSLLFALGASAAIASRSPWPVWATVLVAAVLGDAVNYTVARTAVGPWVIRRGWIRASHLKRTRDYFARFGGSAVTIGRFVPVVRTIAPFVAGFSEMPVRRFLAFNALGGVLWSALMIGLGSFTGRIPWVQQHFGWVTLGIVILSLVPLAIQFMRSR